MTKRREDDCEGLPEVVCMNRRKVAALRGRVADAGDIEGRARVHKALGHPGRLAVLHLLALDACCVCDVAHVLRMPVSTASQHLHALRRAGLATARREGKLVFYSAAGDGARALVLSPAEAAR